MVSMPALECIVGFLDHAPILLTTRLPRPPSTRWFKFELGWLQREGFQDMLKKFWERHVANESPIVRWNNKMRSVRKHLYGWARHTTGLLRKEKQRL
jgi:hypothetical protein